MSSACLWIGNILPPCPGVPLEVSKGVSKSYIRLFLCGRRYFNFTTWLHQRCNPPYIWSPKSCILSVNSLKESLTSPEESVKSKDKIFCFMEFLIMFQNFEVSSTLFGNRIYKFSRFSHSCNKFFTHCNPSWKIFQESIQRPYIQGMIVFFLKGPFPVEDATFKPDLMSVDTLDASIWSSSCFLLDASLLLLLLIYF